MIVIQHIETYWTKLSRGWPGSALRNGVPRALPVPIGTNCPDVLVHKVDCTETDNFAIHQKVIDPGKPGRYWNLVFGSVGDIVQVWFEYSYASHGQPKRKLHDGPLFLLEFGQTGTLHINGRFATHSGQYYTQHFVNVAHVQAPLSDIFLRYPPTYFSDNMADLF
jgi:hypothetical protein